MIGPNCAQPLTLVGAFFGNWTTNSSIFLIGPAKTLPLPLLYYDQDNYHAGTIQTGSLPMYILWSPMAYSLRGVGATSRRPRRRMVRFERFFGIKKGQPFVWECHDCHEGVVVPGTCKNIHGELVRIDPKTLDPNTEVMRF